MNLPNRITLCRLLLIPVFVFFYLATFIPYGKLVAAIIFAVACLTDFLDGHIARKRNMVTTLGNFFDTVADKLLVMSGLLLVVAYPQTPVLVRQVYNSSIPKNRWMCYNLNRQPNRSVFGAG